MTSRLIISLPSEQKRILNREARRRGISAAELVRRSVRAYLAGPVPGAEAKEALLSLIGIGEADGSPGARRHHRLLREALAAGRPRRRSPRAR